MATDLSMHGMAEPGPVGAVVTQRNRYPETGCNGAPSLSNMTDFHVNVTETLSDGARVFTNGNRRTLPHGTVLIARSRDISHTE